MLGVQLHRMGSVRCRQSLFVLQTAVHEFSVKKLREHATAVFQEQVGTLVRQVDQRAAQGTALDLQVGILNA
jgi:hypothetical protein